MTSIADGAEALVLSFLNPVLENEWGITNFQQSLLGSMVFVGFFIGCITSGQLGDRFGRRLPLIFGLLFNFIFGFSSAFSENFLILVIIRGLYGVTVGIISPLSATFVCEITPQKIRGKVLIFFGLFFTFGELMTCLIAYIFMDDLGHGNWRAITIWSSIPGLLTFILCCFFLEESPRYLLVFRKYNQFYLLIDKILKLNSNSVSSLTENEINSITNWAEEQQLNLVSKQNNANPKELFSGNRKRITPWLWIMWFVLTCVYYGIIFVLPEILSKSNSDQNTKEKNDKDFQNIAWSVFSELPASCLAMFLVESHHFGRKKSISITFFLTFLTCFIAYFDLESQNFFIILSTGSRFFLSITFSIIYPYTTELYPTQIRTTGLGFASAFSRIGGISMPWISFGFFRLGIRGPFLAYGILCLFAFLASLMIPYDTTGIELDKDFEDNEEIKENNIVKSELKTDI